MVKFMKILSFTIAYAEGWEGEVNKMRKIKLWKRLTALALSAVLLISTSSVFAEESGQAEQNLQAREADGFVIEDEQAEQDEQTREEVDEPVAEEEQEELNTRTREAATDGLVIEDGVLVEYTGESANVIIPDGVTSIGSNAFSGCTKLKNLTLPSKVKSIGSNAFYGCKNLKKITIKTAKLISKGLGKKALKGIPSKAVLRVLAGKQRAYQKLFYKKGLNRKVKIK